MLSYRHAFHAGNFADVLKHSVLTLVLDYMTRKEKGFTYVDSHAGAGMYSVNSDYAQKTGEYQQGIAKLLNCPALPTQLQPYIELIQSFNPDMALTYYPGSPGIARQLMRRQDSAHLFELHPTDSQQLQAYCQGWRKAFVKQQNGYQGVLSLLPPPSRRGVVLIDPPYEIKSDYQAAVQTIIDAYKKFPTGSYLLWYPVVNRSYIEQMQQQFTNSAIRNVLQLELCMRPDNDQFGMTGTGLFIVNPPWQLAEQMQTVLPFLTTELANNSGSFDIQQLIAE
jgi:23S rRNA (adenine2030-N6)-methyltransferase